MGPEVSSAYTLSRAPEWGIIAVHGNQKADKEAK
jgi:hypothetical protein